MVGAAGVVDVVDMVGAAGVVDVVDMVGVAGVVNKLMNSERSSISSNRQIISTS